MRRIPPWAKAPDKTPVLDDVAPVLQKNERDLAADSLKVRSVGSLPLDPSLARAELSLEQRALRGSRPRKRRWAELDRLDRRTDEATQRLDQAGRALQVAEQALTRAPEDDARSLADWIEKGERGNRPAARVYERERERDAARLLVDAATKMLDQTLERRLQHVERNRGKMLKECPG